MIFSLTPMRLSTPLPYPGGPNGRDVPFVRAIAEHGSFIARGVFLVDPAADSIVLPDQAARQLKIDLSNAPAGHVTAVGGSQVPVRYCQLTLELRSTSVTCRWRTWVAFGPVQRWLLGHIGGLEYFHFSLDPANEEFMLVPRDSLPRV